MRANQNSSMERGPYPKSNSMPISSNTTRTTQLLNNYYLETGLGITVKIRIGVSKNTCNIDDKNRIKEQYISSQSFHRTPDEHV
jgi:hypothetical protein